jgi:hypothetical protein
MYICIAGDRQLEHLILSIDVQEKYYNQYINLSKTNLFSRYPLNLPTNTRCLKKSSVHG